MADGNYIPSREADLLGFAENFSTKITAAPTTYGLTAAQAAAFATLYTNFDDAMRALQDPVTQSPSFVAAKNAAKDALVNGPGGIRALAAIVQATPGITDQNLIDLRLTVRDREPSPVPPPEFAPEIDVFPPVVRTVKIRLHNEKTIGRRGKPDGAIGATIFSHVGELPPALDDIAAWKLEMQTGQTTAEIEFPSTVPPGSTVWITAYWYNRRGETSPATPPVNTNLPGTLQQAA